MYDVIIIGGGPAGLTAAIYSARAMLKTLLIEKYGAYGGQMLLTDAVDNFPAVLSADGISLGDIMYQQAVNSGAELISETVNRIENDEIKKVFTDENVFEAKAVIAALGSEHRKIGVKNEDKFVGRGVSYCAVCDGGFYKNKTVCVIGGGDTALKDSLYLSNICQKVYLIHRRDEFRGSRHLLEKCMNTENIEIIRNGKCTEIIGEKRVEKIMLTVSGDQREIICDGVFAAVGMKPQSKLLEGICSLTVNGYVIAGEDCATSAKGIYAAGDIRDKKLRQIVTACSDGANAAASTEAFLRE